MSTILSILPSSPVALHYLLKLVKKSFGFFFNSVLCIREGRLTVLPRPLSDCYPSSSFLCHVFCWSIALLSFVGTSLVALVVPVSVGMFVNHKWPRQAKIILKVCVPYRRPPHLKFYTVNWNDRSFQLQNWFSHIVRPLLGGLKVIRCAVQSSRMAFPCRIYKANFYPPFETPSSNITSWFYSTLYSQHLLALISITWVCIIKCT